MQRWEYVRMWRRADWKSPDYTDGWDLWVTEPEGAEAPDREADDLEALNWMGSQGWEVLWVENIVEMPPNRDARHAVQSRLYLMKRSL